MKVTIEINEIEKNALEKEYRMLGLGTEIVGNRPTPMGRVIKKLVDEIKKQGGKE